MSRHVTGCGVFDPEQSPAVASASRRSVYFYHSCAVEDLLLLSLKPHRLYIQPPTNLLDKLQEPVSVLFYGSLLTQLTPSFPSLPTHNGSPHYGLYSTTGAALEELS